MHQRFAHQADMEMGIFQAPDLAGVWLLSGDRRIQERLSVARFGGGPAPHGAIGLRGGRRRAEALCPDGPVDFPGLSYWILWLAVRGAHRLSPLALKLVKHVPSQCFGVNSACFKIALLTYNIISAMKGLCLEGRSETRG
jgi:hypothetical protein